MSHTILFGPADLVGFAFSLPIFSFVLAIPLSAVVILAVRARDRRWAARVPASAADQIVARHRPELLVLAGGALLVLIVFAAENILHGYVLKLSTVEWWRYAVPVFSALLVLGVLLALIATHGTTRPQEAVMPAERRTWASFASRSAIIAVASAFAALVLTCIAAGSVSTSLNGGPQVFLEIPIPNARTDALRPWFFGWAYGVPVLICTVALAIVLWLALRADAIRPFLRPDTVAGEKTARRVVAEGSLAVAGAGVLLSLAGAWRLIADAGDISRLEVEGTSYEVTWKYAEFALAAGWAAPVLEVAAFVLLLLVIGRSLHVRPPMTVVATEAVADTETVR